jgi:hypothetical protein
MATLALTGLRHRRGARRQTAYLSKQPGGNKFVASYAGHRILNLCATSFEDLIKQLDVGRTAMEPRTTLNLIAR